VRGIATELLDKIDFATWETLSTDGARTEDIVTRLRGTRHLLVLDGAEWAANLPDDERRQLADLFARLRGGRTLVLLGSRDPAQSFGADPYELAGLDPQAAADLTERIVASHGGTDLAARTDPGEHAALQQLMDVLGRYPLPMTQVLPRLAEAPPSQVLAHVTAGWYEPEPSEPADDVHRSVRWIVLGATALACYAAAYVLLLTIEPDLPDVVFQLDFPVGLAAIAGIVMVVACADYLRARLRRNHHDWLPIPARILQTAGAVVLTVAAAVALVGNGLSTQLDTAPTPLWRGLVPLAVLPASLAAAAMLLAEGIRLARYNPTGALGASSGMVLVVMFFVTWQISDSLLIAAGSFVAVAFVLAVATEFLPGVSTGLVLTVAWALALPSLAVSTGAAGEFAIWYAQRPDGCLVGSWNVSAVSGNRSVTADRNTEALVTYQPTDEGVAMEFRADGSGVVVAPFGMTHYRGRYRAENGSTVDLPRGTEFDMPDDGFIANGGPFFYRTTGNSLMMAGQAIYLYEDDHHSVSYVCQAHTAVLGGPDQGIEVVLSR
jgi:hypothetical protein